MKQKLKAFTLIELLIVVAIIAILAAIAVPNFLEAQTRSKVSRVKADMRTMTTGIESYFVDYNTYPACERTGAALAVQAGDPQVLERLTTPVSYLTSASFQDPFSYKFRISNADAQTATGASPNIQPVNPTNPLDAAARLNTLIYQSFSPEGRCQTIADGFQPDPFLPKATAYILHSVGPDNTYYNLGGILSNNGADDLQYTINMIYDPTNGTVSTGSIWRSGGESGESSNYAGGKGLLLAIDNQD